MSNVVEERNAPVLVFAYKRIDKIAKCIEMLENCSRVENTELFIHADGYKDEKDRSAVEDVHRFLHDYKTRSKFKTVSLLCRDRNLGLANSIISGVTEVINQYGRVIVVEDDLVVASSFLDYMNDALDYYIDFMEYGSISAYSYPSKYLKKYDKDVFCTRKAECWGWATWANRWNSATWKDTDFESYLNNYSERKAFEKLEAGLDRLMCLQSAHKIDSWAIRWVYYLYKNNKLTVYPAKSFVLNDGFDGTGTHCDSTSLGYARTARLSSNDINTTVFFRVKNDTTLEKNYGKFARRRFPFYIIERYRFLLARK